MEIRIFVNNEEIENQDLLEGQIVMYMDLLRDRLGDLVSNQETIKLMNNWLENGN